MKLYQVHDHFSQIDFDALPNAFVIKTNHDSGTVILVREKAKFDKKAVEQRIEASLRKPYGWLNGEWAASAKYPLVLKLTGGAGSVNVKLVKNLEETLVWIGRLFSQRLISLADAQFQPYAAKQRLKNAAKSILRGDKAVFYDDGFEAQSGYAYFQEFLPNNEFDTRVTVIGNRAFAFRRFNRDDDFRASGSGKIDYNPKEISSEFVELAFEVARKLGTQSCAIDGLWRGKEPVIGEISYTYASWAVQACPGHWDSNMNWHEGHMWPEEAQGQDFLNRLEAFHG